MSNKGNMRDVLRQMGIPKNEIEDELESWELVESMKKDKGARAAMRKAVKEIASRRGPATIVEMKAHEQKLVEKLREAEGLFPCMNNTTQNTMETSMNTNNSNNQETTMDNNTTNSTLEGPPENITDQEAAQEQVLTEAAKEQESRDEVDPTVPKGSIKWSPEALEELKKLNQMLERADGPTKDLILNLLKRGVLPRDWKEAGAMAGGGVVGGLVAGLLLDASTGGIALGTAVGIGGIKAGADAFRKDEELSRDLRAASFKVKRTTYAAGSSVKGFFRNLFAKKAEE